MNWKKIFFFFFPLKLFSSNRQEYNYNSGFCWGISSCIQKISKGREFQAPTVPTYEAIILWRPPARTPASLWDQTTRGHPILVLSYRIIIMIVPQYLLVSWQLLWFWWSTRVKCISHVLFFFFFFVNNYGYWWIDVLYLLC